jgi:hypothetical protein
VTTNSNDTMPVKGGGMQTEHGVAVVVIGALVALIMIRRGFRGVSVGGASIGVR